MVDECKAGESDEKSEVSTDVGHRVRQPIRYQLLLPEDWQLLSDTGISSKDSQFKSPRHHEGDHLGVFWQLTIRTLGGVDSPWVGTHPWHNQEYFKPNLKFRS